MVGRGGGGTWRLRRRGAWNVVGELLCFSNVLMRYLYFFQLKVKKKSFFGLLQFLKLEKFPLINFSSYSKLKMWKWEGSGGVASPVMYFLQMGRGR